jgi:hypothetical protein
MMRQTEDMARLVEPKNIATPSVAIPGLNAPSGISIPLNAEIRPGSRHSTKWLGSFANRSYFVRQHPPVSRRSCELISQDGKNGRLKLQLDMTDRPRLRVLVTRGREIYSWNGPGSFSRSVDEVLQSGHIGTRVLGAHLRAVFASPPSAARCVVMYYRTGSCAGEPKGCGSRAKART